MNGGNPIVHEIEREGLMLADKIIAVSQATRKIVHEKYDIPLDKIDVVYTVYHWRLNQIIEEFCLTDGEFDESKFKNLPEDIQQAYENKKFNQKFKLVYGILPNSTYSWKERCKVQRLLVFR